MEIIKKQEKRVKRVTKFKQDEDEDVLTNYDEEDLEESTNSKGIKESLYKDLFSSDEEDQEDLVDDDDLDNDEYSTPKIIYCSRTHTQLTQFIQELKKTKFSSEIRVVSLASRQKMCINPKVSKLSAGRINEVCLDMKNKSGKDKKVKCQYYDQNSQKVYKDHVLVKVRDIEDLITLGKDVKGCPYYGTRRAVPYAHVIVLPYSSLIHRQTRESLGIQLKDCIVIIDEAHNLVDAVVHSHSTELTNSQLLQTQSQVMNYFEKYKNRLKPKNQNRIKQLLNLMNSFAKYFKSLSNDYSKVINLTDLLFQLSIDNINLYEVEEFIIKSELSKKLNGFIEKQKNLNSEVTQNAIHIVTSFLLSLTNIDKDGKLLIEKDSKETRIKFLLLNPNVYFQEIVNESRSLILAGGTMEPVSVLIQQLFPKVPLDNIVRFSCNHIIADDHLSVQCIPSGPMNVEFDFTFNSRNDPKLIDELGRYLLFMSKSVPDGIVIFFPSYTYEDQVFKRWEKEGMIVKIQRQKKFLREPRSGNDAAEVLDEYKKIIDQNYTREGTYYQGAILSCVVGAKMSEGINFSDGYGRCVIIVGLPYPNKKDPEIIERMTFFDQIKKDGGNEFYESLCMRAVNQSIGRSIRHINDYSVICLLDKRYQKQSIQNKLPKWIQNRISNPENFGKSFENLKTFFEKKKSFQVEFEKERKNKQSKI